MTKERKIEILKDLLVQLSDSANILCTCEADERCEVVEECIKALEQQPSDDCVSRQAMIDSIDSIREHHGGMLDVRLVATQMPPVTPTQRWIPVSERLPEDRNIVLVTAYWHENYQVMMASYFGEGLWWCVPFNNCGDHMQKLNPKAWKPLPKPYEEKRGNKVGWSSLENVGENVE